MEKFKDYSNQKFGRLQPLKRLYVKNHKTYWLCKCDCGNIYEGFEYSLKDLSVKYNIKVSTLNSRLKNGWDIEKALNTPAQKKKKNKGDEVMAQYLCRTVTELPAYMQANFVVEEGTQINAGDVYVAKELNENLHGNWTVYNADMIEDVSKEIPAIVINNSFETLADGRRPDGQPDYTQYAYEEGEVVTAIKLLPEIKMEISFDIIQNRNDIESKGYLIPENGTNLLKFVSTIDDVNSKVYFVIEALKHFRCGGAMGMGFIDTMVVRVKYMPAKPKDQK